MPPKDGSIEVKKLGIWMGIVSSFLSCMGFLGAHIATTGRVDAKVREIRNYVDARHALVTENLIHMKSALDEINSRMVIIDQRTWELNNRRGPVPASVREE